MVQGRQAQSLSAVALAQEVGVGGRNPNLNVETLGEQLNKRSKSYVKRIKIEGGDKQGVRGFENSCGDGYFLIKIQEVAK